MRRQGLWFSPPASSTGRRRTNIREMTSLAWRPWKRRARVETVEQRRARITSQACLLAVLLLGAIVVGLHVRDDGRLSPIDETQHIDYLVKAAHFQIPRLGELDGAVARQEAACRGIELAQLPLPSCADATTAPNQAFPELGIDTSGDDPPLYYVTTGVTAEAMKTVLHLGSVATAARLLGFAWLAAGIVLFWLAMGELGVATAVRTGVSALMVTTPVMVHTSVTVTSDTVLFVGGAAALYAVLRWERRAMPGWALLVIGALCGFAKVSCLLAVAAVSVYLLLRWLRTRRGEATSVRSGRELVTMALAIAVSGLVVAVAWQLVVRARTIPGVPTSGVSAIHYVDSLNLGRVVGQAAALLSPVQNPPLLAPLDDASTVGFIWFLNALLIAAALGGAAFFAAGSRRESLAGTAAILMAASGSLYVVFVFVVSHQSVAIPGRYGLALLPFAAVALAAALHKTSVRRAVETFAGLAVVYTLIHLVTFHPG